jgi:hypothetical protein
MDIGSLRRSFEGKWSTVQVSALAPLLSDEEIIAVCESLGHRWRKSPFQPAAVVRSMIYRGLHPDKSVQNVIEDLAADEVFGKDTCITNSGWCQARSRLPGDLYEELVSRKAGDAVRRFTVGERMFGREVIRFDGTTVSMPDTPVLGKEFGYTKGTYGHSRFPIARICAFLHTTIPVVTDFRVGRYETSEVEMFRQMLPSLPAGAIWVADRYLSNYVNFALSENYGLDWITRLHHRRDGRTLAEHGSRIGRNESLVTLVLSRDTRQQYPSLNLPEKITARLIRHEYHDNGTQKTMWILTSLLDAKRYPRDEIIEAYRNRWGIETHYNYLKTTLDMAVLRSKTPENVRSEIGTIMLAHNLVWMLIYEATENTEIPPERISFSSTVKTVLAYSPRICTASSAKRVRLYRGMLKRIATHLNRHRPGRKEPRKVKRDKKRYPTLRTTREEARRIA